MISGDFGRLPIRDCRYSLTLKRTPQDSSPYTYSKDAAVVELSAGAVAIDLRHGTGE